MSKKTNEENKAKINKLLHNILQTFKLTYEICKVAKAIIKLFF